MIVSVPTLMVRNQKLIFNPTQIAGCKLWLDANQLGLTDGTAVSSWTDESGNANHATQGTGSLQPIFHTNIINGKPTVQFDGTDDFLTITGSPVAGTTDTVLAVIQPTLNTSAQKQYASIYNQGGGAGCFYVVRLSTNFWGTFTSADLSSGNALTSGTSYLLEGSSSGSAAFLYQRGTQVATTGAAQTTTGNANAGVGKDLQNANRQYAGHIAELIQYDTVLSAANRITVENYLIGKYAL